MDKNHLATTLAFDVYGTLIDTHDIINALEKHVGDKASEFSRTWRDKQLEHSFRRGLMQNYENFSICTRNALDYTSSYFKVPLSNKDKEELMGSYRVLPAFDDVAEGLDRAKKAGFRMFAFSNGSTDAVETLLKNAGIRDYFISNPFDVIGAISSGILAAWIMRSPDEIFDTWGIEPTLTINSLLNLAEQIYQESRRP